MEIFGSEKRFSDASSLSVFICNPYLHPNLLYLIHFNFRIFFRTYSPYV